MGISLEVFHKLKNTVANNADSVKALYLCVASTLGFDSMVQEDSTPGNQTLCLKTCLASNVTACNNSSCLYTCSSLYTDFGAVFASLSYLLLLIASVQLILVMVHDSLHDDKHHLSRLKKAFRVTIQKCLLGSVMLATGSRAIYYTIQSIIPDRWGDILLNIYYPSLLSAFSLLICFWAELFYSPSNLEGSNLERRDFLRKYKYSLTFLIFNILVYLLMVAVIIATPLVSDQEQVRMSGIVGTIFAFLFLMSLVGFLHFAIRLFFRPDWQPLFVHLAVLRINLRQQFASVLGVISNALMQGLIISMLVFNMVVRYIPVDGYNLYVCAIVIRVTELILPLWFCCSLWNCRQPKRLWLLNPGLILKRVDDVESKVLLQTPSGSKTQYGTTTLLCNGSNKHASSSRREDGCCWVCLEDDNLDDLFYPCNCKLHRKCIKQWIAKRASSVSIPEKEYMRCQVCRKTYKVKKRGYVCFCQNMQRSHWLMLLGAVVLLLLSIVGLVLFGYFAPVERNKKVLFISCVAVFEAIVMKFLGIRMTLVIRKVKYKSLELRGYSVSDWNRMKKTKQARMLQQQQQGASCGGNIVHYDARLPGAGGDLGEVCIVCGGEEERMGVELGGGGDGCRGGRKPLHSGMWDLNANSSCPSGVNYQVVSVEVAPPS